VACFIVRFPLLRVSCLRPTVVTILALLLAPWCSRSSPVRLTMIRGLQCQDRDTDSSTCSARQWIVETAR